MYIHTKTHTHTYIQIYLHTHKHIYTHIYIYAYIHTYIYTHKHTHIYIYIYMWDNHMRILKCECDMKRVHLTTRNTIQCFNIINKLLPIYNTFINSVFYI